jgi:type IV secretory pathway protease TraF
MQTLQTVRTTDLKVVRRCRLAQYQGLKVTFRVRGSFVSGLVQSLWEDKSSSPVGWIIRLVVVVPSGRSLMVVEPPHAIRLHARDRQRLRGIPE